MDERPEFDKKHFDKLPEILQHRLHMFREHAVRQDQDQVEFFNCYGAMILADNIQRNNLRGIYRNGKINLNVIDLFRKKNGLENRGIDVNFVNNMADKIVKAANARETDARFEVYTDILSYRAAYDKDKDVNNNPRTKTENMPLYAKKYIGDGKLVMHEGTKPVEYNVTAASTQTTLDFGNDENGQPYVRDTKSVPAKRKSVSRHNHPEFYVNDRNMKSPFD